MASKIYNIYAQKLKKYYPLPTSRNWWTNSHLINIFNNKEEFIAGSLRVR